jgi:hypothetical protein
LAIELASDRFPKRSRYGRRRRVLRPDFRQSCFRLFDELRQSVLLDGVR